jgi:hypothetical protein
MALAYRRLRLGRSWRWRWRWRGVVAKGREEQLRAEVVPLADLEELALLHDQSNGLLLRQPRWHVFFLWDRLLVCRQRCPRHMLRRADTCVVLEVEVVVVLLATGRGHPF